MMQAVNVFTFVRFCSCMIESHSRNFGIVYPRLYLISVL